MKINYLHRRLINEWEDSDDMNINTIGDTLNNTSSIMSDAISEIADRFNSIFFKELHNMDNDYENNNENSASSIVYEAAIVYDFIPELLRNSSDYYFSEDDIYNFIKSNKPLTVKLSSVYTLGSANVYGETDGFISSERFFRSYVYCISLLTVLLIRTMSALKLKGDPKITLFIDFENSYNVGKVENVVIDFNDNGNFFFDYGYETTYCKLLDQSKNPFQQELFDNFCEDPLLGILTLFKDHTNLSEKAPIRLLLDSYFYKHNITLKDRGNLLDYIPIQKTFKFKRITIRYQFNIPMTDMEKHLLVNATDVKESIQAASKLNDVLHPEEMSIHFNRELKFKYLPDGQSPLKICQNNIEEVNNLFSPKQPINFIEYIKGTLRSKGLNNFYRAITEEIQYQGSKHPTQFDISFVYKNKTLTDINYMYIRDF